MENMHSEFDRLVIENAKLNASLKAADYEKEKLLELVKNLLSAMKVSAPINQNATIRESTKYAQMKDSNARSQKIYRLTSE